MKYLKRFNEGMTEDEYNRILDKISDLGLNSLTTDEKSKLDNFDGTFDKDRPNDVIITTDHGSWTSNDINPKYLPDSDKDKDSVYNDGPKKPKKEEPIKPEPKKEEPVNKTLNSQLSSRWDNGNGFHTLYKDNDVLVLLEKFVIGVNRVYYIMFKSMKQDNDCRVLKLAYNLNMGRRMDNSEIKITDNNNNVISFNQMTSLLRENNLDFGIFNNAWHYVESNFNNK